MKRSSWIHGLFGAFLVTVLAGRAHPAVTLIVQGGTGIPGSAVEVRVSANDPSLIAGAAFTVTYDTDHLTLDSVVDSSFFQVFFRGPELPGTGVRMCGARTSPGSSQSTLLILHFLAKTDAESVSGYVTGNYPVGLKETTLLDPPAGYGGPLAIPMITGLDPAENPIARPDLAFPAVVSDVQFGVISIDRDGDGLTDTEEAEVGTDRDRADTDDDGLPDGWEVKKGLDPRDAADASRDTDLDGFSNLREFLSGTDPEDPLDKPTERVADMDGDGDVDGIDLFRIGSVLGDGACTACASDLDRNGTLDWRDVLLFCEEFGAR